MIFGASVARLGLGFIASVALGRSLGPTDFGLYALLGVVGSVVGALADPGLTAAAIKRVASVWSAQPSLGQVRAENFWVVRLMVASGAALVVGLVLIPMAPALRPGLTAGLVALTLLGVVASAASGGFNAIMEATGRFGDLGLVLLINPAVTALLALVLVGSGRLDLITALVFLGIVPAVVAAFVASRRLPFPSDFRSIPARSVVDELRSLWRFGRWVWASNLLAAVTAQADLIVLAWFQLGSAQIGAYALAANLAAKADVANQSLYAVALPAASALRDRSQIRQYARHGLLRSLLLVAGLSLLIPIAGPLIVLIYGPAFAASTDLFRGLLVAAMVDVVATPLLLLAFHVDQPGLLVTADAVRVLTLVVVAVVLVPMDGVFGVVYARLASRVVGAGVALAALWIGSRSSW